MEVYIVSLLFIFIIVVVFIRRDKIDFSVEGNGNFFVLKDLLKMLFKKTDTGKEILENSSNKNVISNFFQGNYTSEIFDTLEEELQTHSIKNTIGNLRNWDEKVEDMLDNGDISVQNLNKLKNTSNDLIDLESRMFIINQIEKGSTFNNLYEKAQLMTSYNKDKKKLYSDAPISVEKKTTTKSNNILSIVYKIILCSIIFILLLNSFMTEGQRDLLSEYKKLIIETIN